jgi:uncharacterized membrane protein HdeD (DUF308 family)
MILNALAKNWWALALRGVAAIIFGVMALVWPSLTVLALVLLFGAYAFTDGVFSIITAIATRKTNKHWWAMLLGGISGIIIAIITVVWPAATGLVLLYLIAVWAAVTGVSQIVSAVELRRFIKNEWMLVLSGVASVILAIFLVAFPGAGALSLMWVIGVYAILIGILLNIFSFRLKKLQNGL